jgi:hypothetical protein
MGRRILSPFNNKPMLYRVIVIAFILAAPIGVLRAQSVTVAELMPLGVGQYVQYNEYDTATRGAAVKSISYYEALQSDLSYQGKAGVSVVRDSLGAGDPSGAHNLHGSFTAKGDLQVYADTAFIADLIPGELAVGVTNVPNVWVDYIKLSEGSKTSYPIMTLNSNTTSKGIPVAATMTISGEFIDIEKVTVPFGAYDSAYRFDISALVNLSAAGGFVKGSFTSIQSIWLVRGIGIVKTNAPIAGTTVGTNSVSTIGSEKEMIAYGTSGASVAPMQKQTSSICFYPDPATDQVTTMFGQPANRIFFYDADGKMIRSFELSSQSGEALLWVADIPNGAYIARVMFADGSSQSAQIVIRH